jgi:hypothetical protein
MRFYRSQLLAGKKEGAELKLLASLRRPSNALPTESQRQHQAKRYAYFLQVFLTRAASTSWVLLYHLQEPGREW